MSNTHHRESPVRAAMTLLATIVALGCGGAPQPLYIDSHAGAVQGSSRDDGDFDKKVEHVRQVMSAWPHGSGLVVQYVNTTTNARLSLTYVDPTAPEWKPASSQWLVLSRALMADTVISTVSVLLPALEPGNWQGDASRSNVLIAAALGTDTWNALAPGTALSINPGGWCRIVLKAAAKSPHVEGTLEGALVTNDATGVYRIEKGFIYISQ